MLPWNTTCKHCDSLHPLSETSPSYACWRGNQFCITEMSCKREKCRCRCGVVVAGGVAWSHGSQKPIATPTLGTSCACYGTLWQHKIIQACVMMTVTLRAESIQYVAQAVVQRDKRAINMLLPNLGHHTVDILTRQCTKYSPHGAHRRLQVRLNMLLFSLRISCELGWAAPSRLQQTTHNARSTRFLWWGAPWR